MSHAPSSSSNQVSDHFAGLVLSRPFRFVQALANPFTIDLALNLRPIDHACLARNRPAGYLMVNPPARTRYGLQHLQLRYRPAAAAEAGLSLANSHLG